MLLPNCQLSIIMDSQDTKSLPKLLIAEDNAGNFELLEYIFKKDYDIYHAWNGIEAVEMFNLLSPDIVLMDIVMPEMDGLEASSIIRQFSKNVPIVIVSASAFEDEIEKAKRCGVTDIIIKPFLPKYIKKKVSELTISSIQQKEVL